MFHAELVGPPTSYAAHHAELVARGVIPPWIDDVNEE